MNIPSRQRYIYFYTAVFIILSSVLSLQTNNIFASESTNSKKIQVVIDLQKLGAKAKSRHLPIVIVYSAIDCEHCERLEEEVLNPLVLSGELDNLALMRRIVIDGVDSIKDYSGQEYDAEDYAYKEDVDLTPTIQFVDGSGNELMPKLIGYQTPSMFISYIRSAVAHSIQNINK